MHKNEIRLGKIIIVNTEQIRLKFFSILII